MRVQKFHKTQRVQQNKLGSKTFRDRLLLRLLVLCRARVSPRAPARVSVARLVPGLLGGFLGGFLEAT